MRRLHSKPSSTYQGSSPSLFIGNFGYPDVRGGPLLINDTDNPPDWIRDNLGMEDIVGIRARTIRGTSSCSPGCRQPAGDRPLKHCRSM